MSDSAGPLSTTRLSPTTTALNDAIPDGISSSELKNLKAMAAGGAVPLLDINNTMQEVADNPNLTSTQRSEVMNALTEMKAVAEKAAGSQADALTKTLGWIDTLNPFAYVRAAFGGARVGIGQTW